MPTPESEAFKAKKPTVPPTFVGVDFTNNQQVWDARDAIIREQWVKQMMARLVREELGMSFTLFVLLWCRRVILLRRWDRPGKGGLTGTIEPWNLSSRAGRRTRMSVEGRHTLNCFMFSAAAAECSGRLLTLVLLHRQMLCPRRRESSTELRKV